MNKESVAVLDRLRIFEIRGQMVVLDSDLATIYGVQTKVFNQAIRRNTERFPDDFLFRLSNEEWTFLRSQIVTSSSHGGRRHPPLVFTEHGAIMAATVLNSPRAVAMSVYVVRAFVRMRNELLANTSLEKRLTHIEQTLITHDGTLRDIYEKIRPLLLPPPERPKRQIGFHADALRPGSPQPWKHFSMRARCWNLWCATARNWRRRLECSPPAGRRCCISTICDSRAPGRQVAPRP